MISWSDVTTHEADTDTTCGDDHLDTTNVNDTLGDASICNNNTIIAARLDLTSCPKN